MKTLEEYLDDPRILNDPDMENALEPIRELHAIRLKIQDETTGMSAGEKNEFFKRKTESAFAEMGLPPPQYVNFAGQGKRSGRLLVTI
jgi:hypothetical protein